MQTNKQINIAITAALEAGRAILEIYHSGSVELEYKSDQSPLTLADRTAHQLIEKHLQTTGLPILSEEGKTIPFQEREKWNRFWLVDPLDGTKEFIKRNGEFTVNIAIIENNAPIAGLIFIPVSNELYVGINSEGAYKISNPDKNISFSEIKTKGIKLPQQAADGTLRVVSSRSHQNTETEQFIKELQEKHNKLEIVFGGSSIKLCKIAEGTADIYPRFGPTMEWDTAAGHAIINAAGKNVRTTDRFSELTYNKPDLHNPFFIAE